VPAADTLSIVVPTLNRPEHVRALVQALGELDDCAAIAEVILVDQSDADVAAPDLSGARFPWRRLRCSYRNVSRARNEGVAAARTELVLFVDDDCRPLSGCIAAHVAAHAADDVVVTGPVLPPNGRLVGEPELGEDARRELRAGRVIRGDVDFAYAPPQVGAGNLSVRRGFFQHVGGFDEQLSRFNEDAEFSNRVKRLGGTLRYEPKAVVVHLQATDGGNRAFASEVDAIARMIADSVYFHGRIGAGVPQTARALWKLFRQQALNRHALDQRALLRRTAVFVRAALAAARAR